MAFSLYPQFARVFYSVAGFPHVMNHQLHGYTVPDLTHPYGQVTLWDESVQDADTNQEALLTGVADLFTTDAAFNSILWFTQASVSAAPILRAAKVINIPGTMTIIAGEEHLAVQVTFNFLTGTGGRFRYQLMEANSRNAYAKISDSTSLTVDELNVTDAILTGVHSLSARDESQPLILRSRTCTLNNALRKARRYT